MALHDFYTARGTPAPLLPPQNSNQEQCLDWQSDGRAAGIRPPAASGLWPPSGPGSRRERGRRDGAVVGFLWVLFGSQAQSTPGERQRRGEGGARAGPRTLLCGARGPGLTAACTWRACGSCCWRSRPCARGWRRRWPGARSWLWC